ncbi:RICIN domain-containing protein [Streptomyces sp. NBC_00820]|uniref:RICIN domain-containing protein n=1 Tax=Streptomyces sp. NBC_00820 TaxID=2975842 RepID=UPI002ED42A11|nr:RICIN domain-containing protein [Streptomyces sp. NBC_00820]
MAQGDRADSSEGEGGGIENTPDARLTELLRTPTVTAYPALQELRRRHQPSVLAYARLCTSGDATARRLTAEALTTAARDIARGIEPNVPLRHHLLLLAARSAAGWARDERAAGLDPGLLLVLNSAALPEGPTPSLLPAFQSLPSRLQGLIWYGVVERESAERTAAYLGIGPADVAYGTPQALKSLAQACVRLRLAASDDPRCGDFRRLIEEAVLRDAPRPSVDLDSHRAHCPYCAAAFEDLTALRNTPGQALAEGLLPWRGTSYTREDGVPTALMSPVSAAGSPPRRRYLLASAALGVALVPLLVFLLHSQDDGDRQPVAATPSLPATTVPATVSPSPSLSPSPTPSPTPKPTHTSKPPSPSATSHRPAPPPSPKPPPAPVPPGRTYAQVVNVATGRCLDVRDGDFDEGNDVVTAPCSSSDTQRWSFDAGLEVLRSAADSDYCLDSRGAADRGVGIWECDSIYGSHAQNLRFTVDPDGTIRPEIAIETAVTPDGGDGVELRPLNDGAAQRWRAGSR